MIGHRKFIPLIRINELCFGFIEKLDFPPFLGIKVHLSIGINTNTLKNLLYFMIRNHKYILPIMINDIDALVSKEKLFCAIFRTEVCPSIVINMDSHNNILSFHDWALQTHSPCWDK